MIMEPERGDIMYVFEEDSDRSSLEEYRATMLKSLVAALPEVARMGHRIVGQVRDGHAPSVRDLSWTVEFWNRFDRCHPASVPEEVVDAYEFLNDLWRFASAGAGRRLERDARRQLVPTTG